MRALKELWLIITLIVAASLLLLASDWGQRTNGKKEKKSYSQIAIFQITSTSLLDNHVAGVMDRLAAQGMLAPDRSNVKIYNPQGDIPTANTIVREIVNSPADIVITSSTLALQNFSKVNANTKKMHVFGAVTDPYGSGVGILGPGEDMHPPYLVGIGSFQPVESTFKIAKEMNPNLKKVGVVWNSGEYCSEACMIKARKICTALGIQLVEAVANNTSEVSEAARSLVARGAEAIWVGGDTVASSAINLLVSIGKQADIPVFTNDPSDTEKGALFGLGANYFTVGQLTADMAIDILRGKDPLTIRIENVVPELLQINGEVMTSFDGAYRLTENLKKHLKNQQQKFTKDPANKAMNHGNDGEKKVWDLSIVLYSETEFAESCRDGFIDGLQNAGFSEKMDYNLKEYNAQGDMSTLSSIMTTIKAEQPDLLMVVSTPTLQAALRLVGPDVNIIFTGVGDGVKAGAGKTEKDHLPNVTGISTRSAFDAMARIIHETNPEARIVGTLFTPAEINSILYKDWFQEQLEKIGLKLLAIPVTSSAEVAQAATQLCSKDIDIIAQVVDNLTRPGFAFIARRAREKKIPIYVFDSQQMKYGAVMGITRDYYDAGLEAAGKAIRVLTGADPATIPFNNTSSEKLIVNYDLMKEYALVIPDYFQKKAIPFSLPKGKN
ncbi:ABC transporter substrate-binding protein [Desulfobacter vibrioformis]|uniref:ABC transporter substrate-binding protein n=1 Tax=Desulfobacter vibrioformis TaxID=34031 RepID=UPI0005575574|nr:ABC transporter substrate-binding protein [Desulfobacter vibrioformis]